jgi:2-oxoglutarate ferredoxin oxidoreductase subunit gamma
MNLPSADKYEPLVKAGGLLIWDSSLVTRQPRRDDVRLIAMPANSLATRLGDVRLVNVAMLGALCAATEIVPVEAVAAALRAHLPERHAKLLEPNLQALREGATHGATHPAR